MRFYSDRPRTLSNRPHFTLEHDNWNDYWEFETLFFSHTGRTGPLLL